MNIENKTILVTGGGSGIGLALSQALSENGATVIICGRNAQKLENVKSQYPKLHTEVCDVTSDDQISRLVEKLNNTHGGIDILVNNAGIFEQFDYTGNDLSIPHMEREVAIDLVGPIRMVHHFLPGLRAKKDTAIVNVSSGLAFVPLAIAPVYCATKAGVHSWTRSLRYQLRNTSVKVFELMPPLVDTEMVSDFEGQKMMDPDVLAQSLVKGLKANKMEITPGQSGQMKMMARWAPGFIFKMINKQFS